MWAKKGLSHRLGAIGDAELDTRVVAAEIGVSELIRRILPLPLTLPKIDPPLSIAT